MVDEGETSQDDIDKLMEDGDGGDAGGDETVGGEGSMQLDEIEGTDPNALPEQDFGLGEAMANDVTAIYDIPVQISAVLGRSTMQVSQLLKLGRGAVVELDRKVGEAIDIYVNNRLVARGEVVVVEDKLGVTMTEIVKSDRSYNTCGNTLIETCRIQDERRKSTGKSTRRTSGSASCYKDRTALQESRLCDCARRWIRHWFDCWRYFHGRE